MVKYSASLDATFAALADPTRRAILARLAGRECSVSELAAPFEVSLPAISKHLRVLEGAGLLVRERDGRVHRCRLDPAPLDDAAGWIARYRRLWEAQLDALAHYLERTGGAAGRRRTAAAPTASPRARPAGLTRRHSRRPTRRNAMADLMHEIRIDAPPEKVYEAIATTEGLRAWWTADSTTEPRVGGRAEFGFEKRANVFRMRIDELAPGRRITWTCLGDPEEWKDTKLAWEITPDGRASVLRFTHGNWRTTGSFYASCNTVWGELMHRLRAWAEGKPTGPRWTR